MVGWLYCYIVGHGIYQKTRAVFSLYLLLQEAEQGRAGPCGYTKVFPFGPGEREQHAENPGTQGLYPAGAGEGKEY